MIVPKLPYWPNGTPFHEGELLLQTRFGVASTVAQYAPKVIRPFMPDQHREFYVNQPFLAIGARDSRGMMWATILTNDGETDFIRSPDPFTLSISAKLLPGDALEDALRDGDDIGILGIEFSSKRRNRVNGRIRNRQELEPNLTTFDMHVSQSFGNCPQYIKPMQWWKTIPTGVASESHKRYSHRSRELSNVQIQYIKNCDTIFVASGYRGEGDSPSFGNDVSHRGGPKGWIKVLDSRTIVLPDFHGNNHYNSLGNVVMDNRFGVSIPLFDRGAMIQMTGRALIDYNQEHAENIYPGALRLVVFTIDEVVSLADRSLPIIWNTNDIDENVHGLQVVKKIQETADVTSFYLRPRENDFSRLSAFKPGQHLPVILRPNDRSVLMRTYSLSTGPSSEEYRISVKREPLGLASKFLHDQVHVGDTIEVQSPSGSFILDESIDLDFVLISAGIGVTPVLSMLHKLAKSPKRRNVFWVHGAHSVSHHAFRDEVMELAKASVSDISCHIAYSKPTAIDSLLCDSVGRISSDLISKIVPDLNRAQFYICGPNAFMVDIENGLLGFGVPSKRINYETF